MSRNRVKGLNEHMNSGGFRPDCANTLSRLNLGVPTFHELVQKMALTEADLAYLRI